MCEQHRLCLLDYFLMTSPRGLRCGMVSCFVFAVCACVASLYRDVVYEYVGFTLLNLARLRRAPCCVVDFDHRDFVRTLRCVALLCCLPRLTSRSACVIDVYVVVCAV